MLTFQKAVDNELFLSTKKGNKYILDRFVEGRKAFYGLKVTETAKT